MSVPAGTSSLTDRDALLEAVRAAGILTPAQLSKAATIAPPGPATDAAKALIAAGLLTQFQAVRILAGRANGFQLGQYIILDQVGSGTMSRVYKAKHRTMNRAVAIKVLAAELTRTAEERQTLHREVRTAGKLSHPNIVTAYDANELQDRFYIVLDYVDGPSLETLVKQRGPLPVAEACELLRQIATGLQHAHEQNMVHRDIKPGNLLVTRPSPLAAPLVKIANFGLPKLPGVVDYAAPEQIQNPQSSDPRSDLYSLGCVFYFLLTGRAPFAGGTAAETARHHLNDEVQHVAFLRPDVPPAVAAILHRLLAKNPSVRFASASDLIAHLDSASRPVLIPQDCVSYDLPQPSGYAPDSGYLSSKYARPNSPFTQLTEEGAGETVSLEMDATPAPFTRNAPRRRRSMPLWIVAILSLGGIALCVAGIGFILRTLGN